MGQAPGTHASRVTSDRPPSPGTWKSKKGGPASLGKLVPPCGLVLVFLWFDSARGEAPLKPASLMLPARPDETWNAVFDRRDGWTGADVAGTIALGDGRMLWVFGDTWIGAIRGGRRLPGARMVNNSIAVHSIDPTAPWKAPAATSVRFYWGPSDREGRPTAWIVPPRKVTAPNSASAREEWLWPTGGGLLRKMRPVHAACFCSTFALRGNRGEKACGAFPSWGRRSSPSRMFRNPRSDGNRGSPTFLTATRRRSRLAIQSMRRSRGACRLSLIHKALHSNRPGRDLRRPQVGAGDQLASSCAIAGIYDRPVPRLDVLRREDVFGACGVGIGAVGCRRGSRI